MLCAELAQGLTLRVQSGRLIKHLRQLPPQYVDAEEYLVNLGAADEGPKNAPRRGRVKSATARVGSLLSRRPAECGAEESNEG